MHAKPDVAPDAIGVIRKYFTGPIGVYAESGDWAAPNWVFNGLSPDEYVLEADSWGSQGAQIIGGCSRVWPRHLRVLPHRLATPPLTTATVSIRRLREAPASAGR